LRNAHGGQEVWLLRGGKRRTLGEAVKNGLHISDIGSIIDTVL